MDSRNEFGIENSIGMRNDRVVDTVVTNHLEMLIRDMNNKSLNEINSGNGFNNEFVIFVPVVMESNRRTIIGINARRSNNGSAEIPADVLGDNGRIAVIGLGINIEALAMVLVNSRFNCFEGISKFRMKSVEEGSTKRLAKESVIKVLEAFPGSNTPDSDFRDKDVNVRIPLKAAAKGVEDTDKAGSEAFSLIEFTKQAKNDIADGVKKTVEKRTVSAKKDAKFLGNGKNTMSMNALDNLKRHGSSALNGIEVATGGTETAFAAEWDEFKRTTRRTPKHGAAKGRIAAMNHLLDALHDDGTSFKGVLDFFVMI